MSLRDVMRAARGKPRAADEDPPEDEEPDEAPASEEEDPPADEDAAEEEEDEAAEEDDEEEASEPSARARERKRIRAIVGSPAAKAQPDLARHLAYETDLSAKAAIAALKTARTAAKSEEGLGSRMEKTGNPKLGTGASSGGGKSPDRLVEFARAQAEASRARRRA
jgi:hypothetical protein